MQETKRLVSIPVLGKSPGVGNDNLLQYSCLENAMDRETWWATIHGVLKSQTLLNTHTHTHTHTHWSGHNNSLIYLAASRSVMSDSL